MSVNNRHLAEQFSRAKSREHAPSLRVQVTRDLHAAVFHHVHAVAGVAFLEDGGVRGELSLDGHCSQGAQLLRRKAAEEFSGFEGNHAEELS